MIHLFSVKRSLWVAFVFLPLSPLSSFCAFCYSVQLCCYFMKCYCVILSSEVEFSVVIKIARITTFNSCITLT